VSGLAELERERERERMGLREEGPAQGKERKQAGLPGLDSFSFSFPFSFSNSNSNLLNSNKFETNSNHEIK
jgi:hypothetical protein